MIDPEPASAENDSDSDRWSKLTPWVEVPARIRTTRSTTPASELDTTKEFPWPICPGASWIDGLGPANRYGGEYTSAVVFIWPCVCPATSTRPSGSSDAVE